MPRPGGWALSAPLRIHGLDQLRGVLAFAVMVYHYSVWSELELSPLLGGPLRALGVYAVSSFYVLSGAALLIVYHKRSVDLAFLRDFAVKRTARIVPLFWLATTLGVLARYLQGEWWPAKLKLLMTYSLAFSWLDPTAYFATGAWSIGNEWAFYTLFPLLLLAWRGGRWWFSAALVVCLTVGLGYAFAGFDRDLTFSEQWPRYIEPLNQLPLFICGIALGGPILRHHGRNRRALVLGGGMSTLLFLVLARHPDSESVELVTGFYRIAYVAICVLWCYSAGIFQARGTWAAPVAFLGRVSYSVYLLHPLVHFYLLFVAKHYLGWGPSAWLSFGLALPLTLALSWASYVVLEKPFMDLGKRLVDRWA